MEKMRITDSELGVMKVLWGAQGSLSTNEIITQLQGTRDWERSTVGTLIKRLVEKKAVIQQKDGVYTYQAAVLEEAYTMEQAKGIINQLY